MADTIEGLMQEARTFADSRSWDQAIESYSRVLELDADNDEACRNLAQIYALRGMLKSVISTYLRLMHIYVARSDMDNAMAVANYVLLLEPESVDVRSELINMYRYRGDTAEVVARSLDLARLYTELDEGERSIELLQAVLKDDPNNADVCRELAEMYIQYGQVERGANQYHQVADLYQASGQLEKACEALERILVVNSNDSGAVFHLGELYSMLGRWEDAEKQFRSALKFDFENLDVMFALGDVCQRKGDLDQASLAYRKIIMTAPDYVLAQERLGEVYHLQNNIELAIKAYLTAAGLYVNNSDSEHAIALYQRVIFLDPNNPTATRELTNLGAPVVGNDGGIQPLVKAKAAKGAKGESRREKKDGEHKTRSGLVPKGGGGMRAGLMAKGSATKPGLGGKPMLGGDEGEEAPRPGLMRAGLKPMGGGKPTLGGKPMLGGKRVLGSRKKKNETAQVEAKEEHKSVSLAKETEAVVPDEHEIQENHEIEATQATEAHAEPEQAPVAEATEQNDIVPVDENAVLPVTEEDMQHDPSLVGTDVENELHSEAVAQDVAYEDYTFEAPQAPQAPAGLSHEEAPVVEQHDNDNIYPSVEGAASVDGEQFGAIETSPEPEVLSHDETNQVPTEHAEQPEYYAGAYDSEASSDELYGVAAPEHADQLTGTEQLQDASHSATNEHAQFDGLNDSTLDNHYADAQVYDHEHDVSIEGAELASYPETVPQNYPEQGQLDGNEVHDGSYVDPNAQIYDGQHDQFNGTDNYEGAYPEYYEMRPLIMVPEGQLIVPTPILYLERTDLYEAICQAVTEAPDPSVIPWEPLKAVDEVAIEEKMAQQSAEAARAEAEAAAAAQAQAEAAHSQEDFQSVEGFDFNSGINLKGVSETGLRRKHSKGESSGRSSKLMGSQSLSERMARMRAESADTEEAVEHRTISGISRHHQDKPQKKEKGRSIMGGISRPLNQIIEEANQNNGVAVASQETVPEVPRPELTPSRSRSSLSERIKKARQSKAAAKAQSEEMAAVKAEQSFQSTEHAAVTSGEYASTQADEATFAPPAGYEQPIQDQQFNDYQPEAQVQPVEAQPEGEQLMGGYDYQQPEAEAQPVDAQQSEGEQLMGGYDYQPEAKVQHVEAQPEGEQLMGGYDYEPEAQAQPVDAQPEGEQLMGGYDYQQPEAEAQPVDAQQPEGEQLMGGYDYEPEAQAQHVEAKTFTVVSLAKVADAVEPEAVATVEPTEEAAEPEAVATVEPTEEAVEPEAVATVEPTEEAVEPEAVATVEPTEEAVEPEAVATVEPTEEAVEPEAVATVEPTEEAVEPEAVATVEPTEEAVEPEAVATVEPTEEAVEPEAVATVESTEEAVEPEAVATVEPTEEAVEPIDDGLCSLSVESELPPEYLEEAKRLREKLVGADVTTAIGDYRRAIENSPENLVLRTDLADVHLRFSLMDDAINQYRQILRRKPDSVALRHRLACAHLWNEDFDEAVNVYFDLVELHTKNEQYADVIDVLQTILSLDPQNFKARRLLIERFIAQDKIDLAIHHLRQFVDTALSLGSVDNAISALKQLIELSDDPAFVERLAKVYEDHDNVTEAIVYYRILSKRYTQEEKWTEALAICEKLVSLEPDNFDERRLLISLYQNLGRYDKAMAEQFSLAGLYKEQDKVDEAAELYEAIIQKDPNHYEARRCLVDCYLAKGDLAAAMIQAEPLTERYQSERLYAQAIEMYRRLVDADPTSVELREKLLSFYTLDDQRDNMLSELLTLDEIHENKGEYREAVRYLRRAIELAPERAELHCRLARLYDEQLQSVSGAMQEYKKVFELNPGDAAAMSRYAQLLVNQRKPKEAASVLLKLQSVDKEVGKKAIDDICQSFLDKISQDGADLNTRFSYGELCYHLNRISDAIEQFQKTHVDRDLELRSRNMLGLSFIKMPRMREMAIRQFRLGLDTKGHAEQDYLELRYNLAMLFYQTDRLQEALTEFKSILAFDVTYRDVEARVKDLQAKIAAGGGASKGRGVPPRRK